MEYILKIAPTLLRASLITVQLFVIVLVTALPLGWLLALARVSRAKVASKVCEWYIMLMRGTPLLLQMAFVYYALPFIVGVTLEPFPAAFVAFSLNYAAYFAEIFRGGIQSIEPGQYEAADVLGMTRSKTMSRIILPQAFKRVIPSVGNEVVTLIKDTALASSITVLELMRTATIAVTRDFEFTPYVVAAALYLIMTYGATKLLSLTEKRFSYYN